MERMPLDIVRALSWILMGLTSSACLGQDSGSLGKGHNVVLSEVLRLGDEARGDTVLFGSISSIAVNSTGQIFVGEWRGTSVYVFSGAGELDTAIGRDGEGPGEFKSIRDIYIGLGDSIFVFDGSLDRMSAFEPSGRQLVYTVMVHGDDFSMPICLVGVSEAGAVLQYVAPFHASAGTGIAPHDAREDLVNLVDWRGEVIRLLHKVPHSEAIVSVYEGGISVRSLPFGRKPIVRYGPDKRVYAGWNDAVDIRVIGLDGIEQRSIERQHSPVPVTNKDMDALLASITSKSGRQVVIDAKLPDTKPAYSTFVVDDRGRIWMRPSVAEGLTTAEWSILDGNGSVFASTELPASVTLMVVRSGKAYGTFRDVESGAEYVVAFEIDV